LRDEGAELSIEEDAVVEPVLLAPMREKKSIHNQRSIFDRILAKFGSDSLGAM
jgi:hypothetical protein